MHQILANHIKPDRKYTEYIGITVDGIVAEAFRAEGLFRRLKSTVNKLKYPKFRFSPRRPTVFQKGGTLFYTTKTSV